MPRTNRGVLVDGCFDPLHVGHLRYLEAAWSFVRYRDNVCEYEPLIVNVAPDDAIRAKGREPFQSESERMETMRALRMIKEVCSVPLADAVRHTQPRLLVKGVEWADRLPSDVVRACYDCGTVIVYTDTLGKTSTERLAGVTHDGR